MFATRKKEHETKVRVPKRDIEDGIIESGEYEWERKMGDIVNIVTSVPRE